MLMTRLADMTELVTLLYPLGLFNQRASSLVRFSQQYLDLGWPIIALGSALIPSADLPPLPSPLDVKIFHGAGMYASDSFRIYSDLLPGKGGPETEDRWLEKRGRAMRRIADKGDDVEGMAVEEVGGWISDEEGDDGGDEWRSVRPNGPSVPSVMRRLEADSQDG